MTEYTSGNYTVNDDYVDTNVASPKDISVPDLDFASDYALQSEEPNEVVMVNKTSASLSPKETIRYARSVVNNIYQNNKNIASARQSPVKSGVQIMAEIETIYTAVNDVSGEEYDVPCKGRIVLRVPNSSFVTEDMLADILNRTIAAIFAGGSTDETMAVAMARGVLIPTVVPEE
jgi:hypothetical protein